MKQRMVTVVGAGLAGCEAAWQLLRAGVPVRLIDMKPDRFTPAHRSPGFAELVCSNSLRARSLTNAVGLLKEEMRRLDSLIIEAADRTATPAGGALAVDRDLFSKYVTDRLLEHPLLTFETREIHALPEEGITIIATGPLTQGGLFEDLEKLLGSKSLHFFDAAAPIIEAESINRDVVYARSRYDKGSADYLNCPMDKEQYEVFLEALVSAELADVADFDREIVFEGCVPIETLARRGPDTMRFGPLKPVGLTDPRTGRQPYAVVQLRQDNRTATLFNMVGFQTRLKFPEQRRVFRMIPGLEEAAFARYGVMHRNTFLQSPGRLDHTYRIMSDPRLYCAGQMTGVEGYVESASSGLVAGRNAALAAKGQTADFAPGSATVIGALAEYISDPAVAGSFQPINANFGLVQPLVPQDKDEKKRWKNKTERNKAYADRSLEQISKLADRTL